MRIRCVIRNEKSLNAKARVYLKIFVFSLEGMMV